ncbi:MAG: amidohydrolase family protein [Burkholderiales bacterium]
MVAVSTPLLISNVRILDATGAPPFAGEVRIEGENIVAVARGPTKLPRAGVAVLDGAGATLMPGLIEPHAHLSFTDFVQSVELGAIPPEDHTLLTARNALRLLDAGFTSCFSAASAKPRLDVAVRDAINRGDIPGPRLLAASPELTVTAGLGDVRLSHLYRENFALVCDGPDEFRRIARTLCREGVDTLKINVSGDSGVPSSPADATVMTDAEVAAVCEVARTHGKRLAAHARSAESVKLCLKHGVDVLYHVTLVDNEAKDQLEAARDRVFVAPVIGHLLATLHDAPRFGIRRTAAHQRALEHEIEMGIDNMRDLKRRGVRILPGGDYGFAWNPNGSNARDIGHFVKQFGFSPMDAIVAATRLGGEIMGMADRIGQVRTGYLADLILVEGAPLDDVTVLADSSRIRAIVRGGNFHRLPVDWKRLLWV